jgi:hypothetical protein
LVLPSLEFGWRYSRGEEDVSDGLCGFFLAGLVLELDCVEERAGVSRDRAQFEVFDLFVGLVSSLGNE